MFLDCPAYMDEEGAVRCGLPAEVRCRFIMGSSDGPLESAMIRCPAGHWFNGPIEFLTWEGRVTRDPRNAGGTSGQGVRASRASMTGLDGRGGFVVRDFPEKPEQEISRSNCAPAYYLGRPAWLWITAMRPRRRRTAPDHLIAASNRQLDPDGLPWSSAAERGGAF